MLSTEEEAAMDQIMSSGTGAVHSVGTTPPRNEAHSSGVSWSAVIAGGFVTAAISLILLSLGTGLGLSSISVWSSSNTISKVGAAAIIWMIFTHFASAAFGGYLAGRLRTKWTNIHSDEVYFRDTAHGFLAWSVAVVVTAAFLASAASAMMGNSTAESKYSGAQSSASNASANAYFVDMLFRTSSPKLDAVSVADRSEVEAIFAASLKHTELSADDKSYLDQLVAARTGLSNAEADKRVGDTFDKAKEAADTARKILAHTLLWAFCALLIGAFSASFAATIGGRQRDHVVVI
jgi:hypothetical protein